MRNRIGRSAWPGAAALLLPLAAAAATGYSVVHVAAARRVQALAAGPSAVYLVRQAATGPQLATFDPRSGRLRRVPATGLSSEATAALLASGALWVANGLPQAGRVRYTNAVTRLSLRGKLLAKVRVVDPLTLAWGGGRVWVGDGTGLVRAIDPRTNRVTGKWPLGLGTVRLAGVPAGVWAAADAGPKTTVRLLVPSGRGSGRAVATGGTAFALAASGSRLWVATDHAVSVYDTSGRRVSRYAGLRVSSLLARDATSAFAAAAGGKLVLLTSAGKIEALAHVGQSADTVLRVAGRIVVYDSTDGRLTVLAPR